MEEEVWKSIPIAPWDKLYEISNLGNVRHKPRLVPKRQIQGYWKVSLRHQGLLHTISVHRLIAAAFIRPPKGGEVVNHKNSDRGDNRLENLEWCTYPDNTNHMYAANRGKRGLDHPCGKIDPPEAIRMFKTGHSLGAIARHFGATTTAASNLMKRCKRDGRYDQYGDC